jgi:sortase B
MRSFLAGAERFLEKAVDIVFALVLIVGLYYVYDSFIVYRNADGASVAAYKPTDQNPEAYKDISENCVGWISIYGTEVDFPIMQGADNNEYLNKDPFGAYSLTGSIFLDSRNSAHFTDAYSLVYGHHVEGEHMFGALDAFNDEGYFNEHRRGELVVDGQFHQIETFAFSHTDASEGLIFNPEREGDRMAWIQSNSAILKQPAGSRIVALSTCKSPTSTLRTILFVSIVD